MRRLYWLIAVAAAALAGMAFAPAQPASAAPVSGLTFVPCRPSDVPAETAQQTPAEAASTRSRGGTWTVRTNLQLFNLVAVDLKDYFRRATLGNLTDIRITDWVTLDMTRSQLLAPMSVAYVYQSCRDKAEARKLLPAGHGIVVMVPSPWCLQGAPGWACVSTGADAADIAHEAMHALGLNHSWGGDPPVEYGNLYSITGDTSGGHYQYVDSFGSRWGPGIAAPELDLLAYLPAGRVFAPGSLAPGSPVAFSLTALTHHADGGLLMARLPGGLTLEYRVKDGPDAGIPGPAVVIHETGSKVTYVTAIRPGERTTHKGLSIATRPGSGNTVSVTVTPPGARQQVFYRGSDNNIHHLFWSPAAGLASQRWNVDGGVRGNPATMLVGDQQHVFYRGSDNNIHHLFWSPAGGFAADLWNIDGGVAGDPVTMLVGTQQHVFYRGTDNNIHHIFWSPSGGFASDRWNVDGGVRGDPATMLVGDQQHVFYRGSDNNIHHIFWSPAGGFAADRWNVDGGVAGDPVTTR
jgi:hypothetical protein